MKEHTTLSDPGVIASEFVAEIRAPPATHTPNDARAIRRKYSRELKGASPEFVLELARELFGKYNHRWLAYEFITNHRAAFQSIGEAELEEFGQGIDSWGSVDCFARALAGPIWLKGQVPDELIHKWAHSEDRWWRGAALVSTVALNAKVNVYLESLFSIVIPDRDLDETSSLLSTSNSKTSKQRQSFQA